MTLIAAALVLLLPQAKTASPPSPGASTGSVVVLETTLGRITIGLDREKAPQTVDNFLAYVRAKHYDGTIFHRVIPGFMIQGGGMDRQMKERPTRAPIRNEAKNGLRNERGTIAMARLNDPHSASAQFFINVKSNGPLDYGVARDGWGYAVFGRVLEGMEVVDKIVAVPTTSKGPHGDVPVTPIVITSAREATPASGGKASPQP